MARKFKVQRPKSKATSKPQTRTTELLLGLDVGTTGVKALLVDRTGKVVSEAVSEYPMSSPQPLWAEQDPEDWWQATVRSVKQALGKSSHPRVAAIGLTGQMHGLVLLDDKGKVIRPCIMWNDQRSAPQCAAITEQVGAKRILELTGNPLLPGFLAPKLAWVRENEPDVFRRIDKVLLPKDYIRYRLTRESQSDVSDASGTSLFDVSRRCWSEPMLKVFKVRRSWLPQVLESPVPGSQVSEDAARLTGLRAGTLVVAGAGDQAAGAVGVGAIAEGIISVVIGTSGVVFAPLGHYQREADGRLHAFCHAAPDLWHVMGVMLAAGGSLRWFRDALWKARYDVMTREAAKVPAGSDGLLFLPYLSGERTPYPDPNARGVFFGLNLKHTRAHMARAVMEGVSFGLRDSLELILNLGVPVRQIRLVGGGARSVLWQQILADVFEQPVHVVNAAQGAAFGAALLAGVGAGIFTSVKDACNKTIRVRLAATPGKDAETYQRFYPRYRALYAALKDEFAKLAETSG
jgi:xylulokinase